MVLWHGGGTSSCWSCWQYLRTALAWRCGIILLGLLVVLAQCSLGCFHSHWAHENQHGTVSVGSEYYGVVTLAVQVL